MLISCYVMLSTDITNTSYWTWNIIKLVWTFRGEESRKGSCWLLLVNSCGKVKGKCFLLPWTHKHNRYTCLVYKQTCKNMHICLLHLYHSFHLYNCRNMNHTEQTEQIKTMPVFGNNTGGNLQLRMQHSAQNAMRKCKLSFLFTSCFHCSIN